MMVGGTQMPPRVSTGDRDAVLRQIRWCAAVQTPVNCHCKLEQNPVGDGNVEPMQLVVQYLTNAAINLPSVGAAAFNSRCNLSLAALGAPCYSNPHTLAR